MTKYNKLILFLLLILLVGLAVGYFSGFNYGFKKALPAEINSFDECVKAGFKTIETTPPGCETPDGRLFIENANEVVACTMDAKICPDGSAVGRVGPNCEFAPCPISRGSGIIGTVLLGPTCPVVMNPPDPSCDDKPFQTTLAAVDLNGKEKARFYSDGSGKFKINLSPGKYIIQSAVAANVLPYCNTDVIVVTANRFTETIVNCDTGIR